MKKSKILLFLIFYTMIVISCDKKVEEEGKPLVQKEKGPMKNITSKPPITFESISAKLANMPRYNFYAIKDPFYTPLVQAQIKQTKPKKQRVAPTEKYEIEKYNLIGVMINKKVKSAIFEDPEGKGWVVKEGMPIGQEEARIKKIAADGVYIEEVVIDNTGKEKKQERFIPIKKVR